MALHNREFPVHRNEVKVNKKVPLENCQQSIIWTQGKQGSQNVPAISPATSGWVPSTDLSKIKIEVGKTEMLSRYLLFSRSLL